MPNSIIRVQPKIGQPQLLNSETIPWQLVKDTITSSETEKTVAIKKQGISYSSHGIESEKSIPVAVPGTILNAVLRDKDWLKTNILNQEQLVKEGKTVHTDFFDPFFDTNQQFIPDIFDKGIEFYTYWYYAEFSLKNVASNQRFWLNFRGLNYTADVFVNGVQKGTHLQGMFLRNSFDITDCPSKDGVYRVAVRIEPPSTPGKPTLANNGGVLSVPNIGECVTMRHTVGWDWTISIPDRSTGIWDQVSLTTTKTLVIKHPKVTTKIKGTTAIVTIQTQVYNPTNEQQTGFISYELDGKTHQKSVTVGAGKTLQIDFPPLDIINARLWWPHGTDPINPENKPELYELNIYASTTKEMNAASLSDQHTINIGMREFSNELVKVAVPNDTTGEKTRNSRQFLVNGLPVMIRGGNWMGMDTLFRNNATRYKNEVRMHKEMNLNLIRVWGGGHIERPEFYEACDELGIMVMQEFWFSSEFIYEDSEIPENYKTTCTQCAIDTIQMLRNHTSLLFWCAANESKPPTSLLTELESYIGEKEEALYDTTRLLVHNSLDINGNGYPGTDGPYGILELNNYFKWLPDGYTNSFNPEIGSLGIPTVESIQRMIRAENLTSVPEEYAVFKKTGKNHPIVNESWKQLKYSQYMIDHNVPKPSDQIYTYGTPKDIEAYCERAQLVNHLHYKELWEGYLLHMKEWYTGLIIWKSQGCWTGVRAKLYDWFLEQNGGFWGVKTACEPIHVQLNLENYPTATSYDVHVVNQTTHEYKNLNLHWEIYDVKGSIASKTVPVKTEDGTNTVCKTSTTKIATLTIKDLLTSLDPDLYFVILKLVNGQKTMSRNFYWLSKSGDYLPLDAYSTASLTYTAKGQKTTQGNYTLQTTFKNNNDQLSFWNRLQVRKPIKSSEDIRVLPVFYEKNYFSLSSQEQLSIGIEFQHDQKEGIPELWIREWNQKWVQIPINWGK
ncbi:hypothetical protein GCM10011344_36540 [Dokdonia pacifica]|uniref:Mannosylglycoprotein endo-beta-mannosidase n=1 Tax=Dokdonia pacifica TaxID=1627892 RepID=A0A239AZ97_9FLAO|nr:glycoside hydrolase family 2 TIM barrel-domain containing protein [Dokdonia pacifica]GGG32308.1 hypothetical protein GCM10011344_36540 [Dokdonia pacifica]SNS00308.1 mannosylglycoprotein endo-beta-mannosidase [Dokdonia pacifica]